MSSSVSQPCKTEKKKTPSSYDRDRSHQSVKSEPNRSNVCCKDVPYLQVEQVELVEPAGAAGSVLAAGLWHRAVVAGVPGSPDPAGVIVHTAAHQLHIKKGFSDNEKKRRRKKKKSAVCTNAEFQIFYYLIIYNSTFHQLHGKNTGGSH